MKKVMTLFVAILMLFSVMAGALAVEDTVTDPTTDTIEDVSDDVEDIIEDIEELETDEADEDETEEEVDGSEVEEAVNGLAEEGEAGVTPDSPLWGVEKALERINLALTFNKAKKAEKRLVHARERLLEVKEMARKGKLKHAAKAAKAHAEELEEAEEDLAEAVDEEGDTEKVKSLEERFDTHIQVLERVQAKLLEKGVEAPGIANALAIAKAKKSLLEARQRVKEARKSGEGLEDAREGLVEVREEFRSERGEIRERFVRKSADGSEEKVEVEIETSDDSTEESESEEDSDSTEETTTDAPTEESA